MKFSVILTMLSERVKKQIAQEHQQIDEQLLFLLDPHYLQNCWNSMSEDEKQVIRFFIQVKGDDFLTYREMEQTQLPLRPSRFRLAMIRLQRLGFIYTLRRMWGELAYIIPVEIVNLFRKIWVPPSQGWESRSFPMDHLSYHILDDVLQVLNVVRRNPLELSKKGTLPKKSLKQLFEHTQVGKDLWGGFPLSYPTVSPYEYHEALMLELLLRFQLLVKKGNELVLGDIEQWSDQSQDEICRQWVDGLSHFFDLDAKLSFFLGLIQDLAEDHCYSVKAILKDMKEAAPCFDEVRDHVIIPLTSLGFIQSRVLPEDLLFKWKKTGGVPHSNAYIQPNFEILIPSFAPLSLKWELLAFSKLIKKEEMWVFKLEKNAAQPFFETGKSAQDLIRFLQSLSSSSLPDNILEAITDWEKELQQVSFLDARIMKVSHPQLAQELEAIPSISRYFLEKLGEQAFVIQRKEWDSLVHELGKRGYVTGPVKELLQAQEAEEKQSPPSFFKPRPAEGEYKVESVFPEVEDALPGLRQLPRMWISHYSPYHESTLREMVQWAIQLGLELKMEWKGTERIILPHSLVNRHGFWTILSETQNQTEGAIRLDDIGRIQLLVPLFVGKY